MHGIGRIALVVAAVGNDHQLVIGVGHKSTYGCGVVGEDIGWSASNVESRLTYIDKPLVGTGVAIGSTRMQTAIPSGEDAVGSDVRHADMLWCGTGSRQPQFDIV